jgi:hypothetical protein
MLQMFTSKKVQKLQVRNEVRKVKAKQTSEGAQPDAGDGERE